MDDIAWPLITLVALLIGIGGGYGLAVFSRRGDSARLSEAEAELADYRTRVTQHFRQSAEHFHSIGRQYRDLYEHMAAGSQALCEQTESEGALKFPLPETVATGAAGDQLSPPAAAESEPPTDAGDDVSTEELAAEQASEQESEPEVATPVPAIEVPEDPAIAAEAQAAAVSSPAPESTAPPEAEPEKRLYH